MATITKISNGYALFKGQCKHCNGEEYFCNENGEWFYDENMSNPVDLDPVYNVDDVDIAMLERFKKDNQLDSYIDCGATDNTILEAFNEALHLTDAEPGDTLFATRVGKITTKAEGNKEFGKMPEDDEDNYLLWDKYTDAVIALA